jgi:hypothetical protein
MWEASTATSGSEEDKKKRLENGRILKEEA